MPFPVTGGNPLDLSGHGTEVAAVSCVSMIMYLTTCKPYCQYRPWTLTAINTYLHSITSAGSPSTLKPVCFGVVV